MELYGPRTAGGAQYYSTTYVDCANGEKEGTLEGVVLRTDGGILEISNFNQLLKAGFHTIILPNGENIDIRNKFRK